MIYQLMPRSFADADGDGIGDLAGITSKLPYLEWLGVDAIWLTPIYPSPLKDGGYDITDFTAIHPDLGDLDDLVVLLEQAHSHGIRVILDLVLNHTSVLHPWFQRARWAGKGSSERDFYVWRDDDHSYAEAPVLFCHFEQSNWEWDEVAGQYYLHRFLRHQPDLNYDNPAVQEAMLAVVDFWLAKGIDGFRLDAVPFLFEQEGTRCEGLPETHAFLRRLRTRVEACGRDVLLQFLVEAIVISLVGGALGVAMGYGIAEFAKWYQDWPAVVPLDAIVTAVGFAGFVGIFFGFYPARKAAGLDPIEALRFE